SDSQSCLCELLCIPCLSNGGVRKPKARIASHDSVEHIAAPLAGHHGLPPSVGTPDIIRVDGASAEIRLHDGLRDRGQGPGLLIAIVVSSLGVISKPIILINVRSGGMAWILSYNCEPAIKCRQEGSAPAQALTNRLPYHTVIPTASREKEVAIPSRRHPQFKLNGINWISCSSGQIAKLIHRRRRNSNPGVHGSLNQAILRQIRQIWVGSGRCRVGRHKFCFGDLRIGKTKPGNASTTDRRIWWYCAGTAATATADDDCDSHESEKNEPCCRLC